MFGNQQLPAVLVYCTPGGWLGSALAPVGFKQTLNHQKNLEDKSSGAVISKNSSSPGCGFEGAFHVSSTLFRRH